MTKQQEIFNYLFQTKLDSWTPLTSSLHLFFNEQEIALLDRSNRTFQSAQRTIVVLAFENRFASLGGLGAVVRQFPGSLRKQGEKVLLLTPLHLGCDAVKKAIASGKLARRSSGREVNVCNFSGNVSCFEEVDAPVPTWHIGVNGRFCAGDNPYGYSDPEELLFDTLAFCAVVPSVLADLGYVEHLLFHAHDWETAPIALFARCAVISAVIQQVKTVLTLHNSFDAPFPDRFKQLFFNRTFGGPTVLQCMLPFLHGPLTTVSTPFAHELRHDPLQCGVFVDHLQRLFAMNPPLGIENGMFGEPDLPFSEHELAEGRAGNHGPLCERKQEWRESFISIIHKETDQRIAGNLNSASLNDPLVPIFFMSGRLDLMQKGFDTIFHAFKRLKPGSALLFFTPALHNGDDDLSFFTEIADECSGNIMILPFRISSRRYRTFLQGASFLLMPSMYEPFGAASEGLLHGTPLIARATGGLLAQIQPGSDFVLPARYKDIFPAKPVEEKDSIFFKETFSDVEAQKMWRTLLGLPLRRRIENPLYQSIVDAACQAMLDAITIFSDQPAYGSMIWNGLQSVQRYTWEQAAGKYRAVFDAAAFRGQ